jgi:tetratricopeptide (TPR) repeat protein
MHLRKQDCGKLSITLTDNNRKSFSETLRAKSLERAFGTKATNIATDSSDNIAAYTAEAPSAFPGASPLRSAERPLEKSFSPLISGLIGTVGLSLFIGSVFIPHGGPEKPLVQTRNSPPVVTTRTVENSQTKSVGDVDSLLKSAKDSYRANNKITALNQLFAAIALAPANPAVYKARGDYYYNEHKLGSAAEDYKKAIALDPQFLAAKSQLKLCTIVSPAPKEIAEPFPVAQAVINKNISAKVNSLDFVELRKTAYEAMRKGDYDYVMAASARCVKLKPNDPISRRYLTYSLLYTGNAELAAEQFDALAKIERFSLSDKIKFGETLAKNGGAEGKTAAGAYFDRLVDQNAQDVPSLLSIGEATVNIGFLHDGPTEKVIKLASADANGSHSKEVLNFLAKIQTAKPVADLDIQAAGIRVAEEQREAMKRFMH